MRTIKTKVYKFHELSEAAKDVAVSNYMNSGYDYQEYYNEIIDSVKAMIVLFNLKTGRQWSDLKYSHIEDNVLELKGIRLYKYLINNYYRDLFKPKYIKSIDREIKCRQFICKVNQDYRGEKYTMLYSKLKKDNCCVLTGICYDDDILKPVYDFLKRPDKSETFKDIINSISSAISRTFNQVEEWVNSDEFIIDTITANDYEFTKDGKQFY